MCRKECIFTIDPATARDLDDALSCKQLPDGKLPSLWGSLMMMMNSDYRYRCCFYWVMGGFVINCLFNTGNFEVGVHIADVSYFVEEDNALDAIASQRATSVYMVQKVRAPCPPFGCFFTTNSAVRSHLSLHHLTDVTVDFSVVAL